MKNPTVAPAGYTENHRNRLKTSKFTPMGMVILNYIYILDPEINILAVYGHIQLVKRYKEILKLDQGFLTVTQGMKNGLN